MTAPVIETGTRLCRTCKTPLPKQLRGRPRVFCGPDCKPKPKKAPVKEIRRFNGVLNGRKTVIVVGPDYCRIAQLNQDGSGTWTAAGDMTRLDDKVWATDVQFSAAMAGGTRVTVFDHHVVLRPLTAVATAASVTLRFNEVDA